MKRRCRARPSWDVARARACARLPRTRCIAQGPPAGPAACRLRSTSQTTRSCGPSSGARSAPRTWAGASTISPSSKATRAPCYVGFATGGVWKTTNNGTTLTPIFDRYRCRRSAILRSRRRTRMSSTSAPASQQPPELVLRRRRLQVDRRRQDVRERRPQGHTDHRAHRRAPEGSEHRLRRGARAPVRAEHRTRTLQDDRRRQDLDEYEVHR